MQVSAAQALLSSQLRVEQSGPPDIIINPLFRTVVAVISLKFTSTNSRAVGELPKATTLCCPPVPIRLKRIENITESSGSVTPCNVPSSHVNAILPVEVIPAVV